MRKQAFLRGMRDGVPIALGYFAVSFTLGIYARSQGITALQATLSSLLTHASAGQYAAFSLVGKHAALIEAAIMALVINARYLLMSCALSQRLAPKVPMWQRMLLGCGVTDEIFGISMAYPAPLDVLYPAGAFAVASPGWALGTLLGVLMGSALPARVASALSVGLYGMFIAIIVPPAKKSRVLAGVVLVSMALSFLCAEAIPSLSEGMRTVALTVAVSAAAALLFPVREEAAHE